jgi:hypothetical protein
MTALTSLLTNRNLWKEIQAKTKAASRIHAAIAYLGTDATPLLHLKSGDTLVVDMSLRIVKAGATNPSEVKKLLKKGVRVYTRANLHAKVIAADGFLIASSANASVSSFRRLDEAGCMTSDRVAVERAREFIESIALEPVLPNYLRKCLAAYRPPRFPAAQEGDASGMRGGGRRRSQEADLWFVSGLVRSEIPEREQGHVIKAEARARKRKKLALSSVEEIHYASKPKWVDNLRVGDLVVDCVREGAGSVVSSPARFLGLESYPRGRGRRRYLVMLERLRGSQEVSLTEFHRRIKASLPAGQKVFRRTRAVADILVADTIRSVWTPSGTLSRKTKRRKQKTTVKKSGSVPRSI